MIPCVDERRTGVAGASVKRVATSAANGLRRVQRTGGGGCKRKTPCGECGEPNICNGGRNQITVRKVKQRTLQAVGIDK